MTQTKELVAALQALDCRCPPYQVETTMLLAADLIEQQAAVIAEARELLNRIVYVSSMEGDFSAALAEGARRVDPAIASIAQAIAKLDSIGGGE